MTIAQKKRVRVTHIINPNRFFLLDVERSEEIKVLQKVENELQKYCSYEEKQDHHPKKNDVGTTRINWEPQGSDKIQ